jgi:hypothetical protein
MQAEKLASSRYAGQTKRNTAPIDNNSKRADSGKLGFQLQQAERNQLKSSKARPPMSRRTQTASSLSSRSVPISIRRQPAMKRGVSNQLGNGSGSRRFGAGRRITEKVH